MKKSILITGVSGTGKTTVSKKLNELGYKAYDMDDFPGLFAMIDKKTGKPMVGHDNENIQKVMGFDWICDTEKLKSIIANESSELAFYCGNASNIKDIWSFFDSVILLEIGEEAMRQRLTARTENDFGKTSEIQDWLMSWKDHWEEDKKLQGAIVVDAHGSLDKVVEDIIEKFK